MSDTDSGSGEMAASTADKYGSVSEAMKLVYQSFNGGKRMLSKGRMIFKL
jgi:hypothetical protein